MLCESALSEAAYYWARKMAE